MQLQADWPPLEFWGRAIQPMLTLMGTCVFGCLWAAPAVEGGAFVFDLNVNDGLFMLNSPVPRPCTLLNSSQSRHTCPPPQLQESIRIRALQRLAKSRPLGKNALQRTNPNPSTDWNCAIYFLTGGGGFTRSNIERVVN